VTITVSPMDANDFDELRIHLRVGRTQFVASRGGSAGTQFRDALLALARLAAPRLR
jgi:hypothetical protein